MDDPSTVPEKLCNPFRIDNILAITPVVFDHRLFLGFPCGENAALSIVITTAKRWPVNSRR